jgi:hypothetical protein
LFKGDAIRNTRSVEKFFFRIKPLVVEGWVIGKALDGWK